MATPVPVIPLKGGRGFNLQGVALKQLFNMAKIVFPYLTNTENLEDP